MGRHDRRSQPGIGREHPVETDQVQARARHQRGQALHEFQGRHHDVRGAVARKALELQHDITRAIALEPLVGDRGAPRLGKSRRMRTQVDDRHSKGVE